MGRQTSYEVHVQQGGHWQIHARFSSHQKDEAIEEGKLLDTTPGIGKVKVIKEVYNDDEGASSEYVIYSSSMKKADPGGGGGGFTKKGGGHGRPMRSNADIPEWKDDELDDLDGWDDDYDEKPKKTRAPRRSGGTTSLSMIFIKIVLVCLFSALIGVLMALVGEWAASEFSLLGKYDSKSMRGNLMFGLFVTGFILTAIPMSKKFMRNDSILTSQRRIRPVRQAPVKQQAKQKQAPETTKAVDIEIPVEEKPAIPEPEIDDIPEPEPEQEPAQEEENSMFDPQEEEHGNYFRSFLNDMLAKSSADLSQMDNFNKFGVNLFLAGAAEVMGTKREVDKAPVSKILSSSCQVIGFKKDHADGFAEKYQEYLMQDARYMQMFQAGRNAMNTYFSDQEGAAAHLSKALAEWNKPKQKEEVAGPVTVMFTDMVGSTNLTQTKGDAAAQEVVRAHNRITREALTDFGGKEVKHTGDGIMASFPTTSNAVEAAIMIQKNTLKYTAENPELPLHLKIGINAGEPIAEDNDLFGTTVQLAARIVDKAQSEEIFVSEIVRGICAGTTLQFKSRGQYEMKGVQDAMTLYEVVWRDDAPGAD